MEEKIAEYLKQIPEKPKIDASKIIKSPMPGLVKSISCQVGDQVLHFSFNLKNYFYFN